MLSRPPPQSLSPGGPTVSPRRPPPPGAGGGEQRALTCVCGADPQAQKPVPSPSSATAPWTSPSVHGTQTGTLSPAVGSQDQGTPVPCARTNKVPSPHVGAGRWVSACWVAPAVSGSLFPLFLIHPPLLPKSGKQSVDLSGTETRLCL